ncbi:hypothetical protein BDD12DRAFT_882291 [Trichophaea hybrida]|nr:hypothetical protein BDD12DRAFT_882291 [Trichophaea hybrida]
MPDKAPATPPHDVESLQAEPRAVTFAELKYALAILDDPDAEFSSSDEPFEKDLIHGIEKRIVYCGGNLLEIKGISGAFFA